MQVGFVTQQSGVFRNHFIQLACNHFGGTPL
jgi:hypothetical protein